MKISMRCSRSAFAIGGAVIFAACADDSTKDDPGATLDAGALLDAGVQPSDGSSLVDARAETDGASDAALDGRVEAGPADPCGSALFCEKFDGYTGVTTIANQQKFGPWRAALNTGASMRLDGTHKMSGANALHVHIDNAVTAGGRLFAEGAQPIFTTKPTHVYGRMMMYIDGGAEPGSPAAGRNASYILSSLPKNGVNTYSFVYGLAGTPTEPYHDCSTQSATPMPSAWACVSFEMDSVTRKLRMYKDGAATPIVSVDDHGKGCVAPTAVTSPWYGPAINQLFVGAWSFHDMNAPLDVWIDDVVMDTSPVSCPP